MVSFPKNERLAQRASKRLWQFFCAGGDWSLGLNQCLTMKNLLDSFAYQNSISQATVRK